MITLLLRQNLTRQQEVKMNKTIYQKISLTLFIFLFLLKGCTQKETAKVPTGAQAIPVKVVKLERKDLSKTLEYAGNIRAKEEVAVYPKVTGKISEKLKAEGDKIDKDEVIAYIDRDEVGLTFNKAPIQSPLAGLIGRVYVDIGSQVNLQTPVAMVVNMESVKIDLDIPEKYIPKVYLGQEAKITVDAYPNQVFIGKVTQISPVVNPENRAAPIEIMIENREHFLKSGMFAKVSLAIEERPKALVILKEAINGKDPDTYVYVIENNKAILKKVSLGIHQGSDYEATDGLKEGDWVVIVGQQRLYENAPVTVEENGK